jgi:surfeit locus 1 family protein
MEANAFLRGIRRRPFLALCAFGTACVLFALGTWQTRRYAEKKEAQEHIAAVASEPEIPLSALDSPEASPYRRVRAEGRFLYPDTLYLYTGPLVPNGEPGYDALTPLLLSGTDKAVIVNRGWVPQRLRDAKREEPADGGETSISAVVLPQEKPGYFTPDNDAVRNIWFWADVPGMARHVKRGLAPYMLMRTDRGEGSEYPVPRDPSPRKHIPHLQYAFTWYSLLLILAVIYIRLAFRERGGS